jgi:hypothetical protein
MDKRATARRDPFTVRLKFRLRFYRLETKKLVGFPTWLKPCLCKIAFGWRSASSAAVNIKASDGFSRWGAFYYFSG